MESSDTYELWKDFEKEIYQIDIESHIDVESQKQALREEPVFQRLDRLNPCLGYLIAQADRACADLLAVGRKTRARKLRLGQYDKARRLATQAANLLEAHRLTITWLKTAIDEVGTLTDHPLRYAIQTQEDMVVEMAVMTVRTTLFAVYTQLGGQYESRSVRDPAKRHDDLELRDDQDFVRFWVLKYLYGMSFSRSDYNVNENGRMTARPTNRELSAYREGRKGLHRLHNADLWRHVRGEITLYYRHDLKLCARTGCGRHGNNLPTFAPNLGIEGPGKPHEDIGMLLLGIDIDYKAADGGSDAEAVAKWLTDKWFPGCYYEPSTNGHGIHLYVWVGYSKLGSYAATTAKLHSARCFFDVVVLALDQLRSEAGFSANIDKIAGWPTEYKLPQWAIDAESGMGYTDYIDKRAGVIKAPLWRKRLPDCTWFMTAPRYLLDPLIEGLKKDLSFYFKMPPSVDAKQEKNGTGVAEYSNPNSMSDLADSLRGVTDGFFRKLRFAFGVYQLLGAVDTLHANRLYIDSGLARTSDDEQRKYEFAVMLRYAAQNCGSRMGWREPPEEQYVTFAKAEPAVATILRGTSVTYRKLGDVKFVGSRDLALVLTVLRLGAGGHPRPIGVGYLVTGIRMLIGRGISRDKIRPAINALCEAGLIAELAAPDPQNNQAGIYQCLWHPDSESDGKVQ